MHRPRQHQDGLARIARMIAGVAGAALISACSSVGSWSAPPAPSEPARTNGQTAPAAPTKSGAPAAPAAATQSSAAARSSAAAHPSAPSASHAPGSSLTGRTSLLLARLIDRSTMQPTGTNVGQVSDQIGAVDVTTGSLVWTRPLGTPNRDWSVLYTAGLEGERTRVTALDPWSGRSLAEWFVPGSWALPVLGLDRAPLGLAGDERTLVLVEAREDDGNASSSAPEAVTSRFLVLSTETGTGRPIELAGRFDFDALASDGATLYLIEHLAADEPTRYQVRALDVISGRLRDTVVVDKRNAGEVMRGYPNVQLRSEDGRWAYTLYRHPEGHSYIHALDTVDALALCIDLPTDQHADDSTALHWSLAGPGTGGAVYAINGRLGFVAEIFPIEGTVRRVARIEPSKEALIPLADAADLLIARQADLASGGDRLAVVAGSAILMIRTLDLTVVRRIHTQGYGTVNSIALAGEGSTVFAVAGGRLIAVDASDDETPESMTGPGAIAAIVRAPGP